VLGSRYIIYYEISNYNSARKSSKIVFGVYNSARSYSKSKRDIFSLFCCAL